MSEPLTDREQKWLALLSQGWRRKDMSQALKTNSNVTDQIGYNVYQKLGADNAAHAVAIAFRSGLLK